MRKRLVIGAIAAVVIGVTAWIFRPWETRIHYHIRECRQAEREMAGKRTVFQRAWHEIRPFFGYRISPKGVHDMGDPNDPAVRWKGHVQALLDLRYLERREFPFTNGADGRRWHALAELARKELPSDRLWRIEFPGTNVIVIQAERHDMSEWERMIREINEPKTK